MQAGAYGPTFMMPRLFDSFGASEKVVGTMLMVTTVVILGVTGKGGTSSNGWLGNWSSPCCDPLGRHQRH